MAIEKQSCEGCPDCEIRITPDPDDWFCDDDVTVLCKAVEGGRVMAEHIRPYLVQERCPVPHWCPKRKQKKSQLAQQMQTDAFSTHKRYTVFAAGVALALCLAAAVAVRFQTYDPAIPAGSETILDHCLLAGVWLVPFASVCFAKRLFEGHRFRFALSWLVGFLIPWLLLVYETYFPHTPPEGSYCTEAEQCLGFAVLIAIISGAINVFDSVAERLLCKLGNGCLRSSAWLQLMVLLSVLMLGVVIVMVLML